MTNIIHNYVKRFEMWRWRRMEISWIDRVRKEEVLLRVSEQRNIIHTVKRMKDNWIGHIYNTLLKEREKGPDDEEEVVRSYCMTLRKRK
jgi:hypothetical protein